ncbi:MAG TPA: hypothetical protein VLT32_16720 [Candidatus Sulfomarinibacteraceae bacterium]|nr:hypothetical protein [Candidatus Sulfomarinibacteraceae bacterium]
MPAAATSRNYVYVGSNSGQLYGVDVDTGEVRFLSTSTESSSTINALAANDNACIAYYGNATSIYRWDETTDAHSLIADLAIAPYAPPFAGFSLQSGGGTFWNPTNTYYVGAELPGDIEAMYALVMSADGTGIVSITRLDIQGDAAADTDPGDAVADLGGFGDVISIDNGAGGVLLLGATWNSGTPAVLTMWTYDPAGATASARFTRLTPPPGGLNLQLARTPDGRVWAGYDAPSGPNAGDPVLRELDIDLGAKTVAFVGGEVPLDPATSIADLTAPACRPQIGVAKRVAAGPTAVGDGTFTVTFEVLIEALGDFPLWDVQVTDDLATEFGTLVTDTPDAPGEYAISSAAAVTAENPSGAPPNSDLTANPGFDGATDQELLTLSPGDVVEVGATATLRFTVRFYPTLGKTVYENQAVADGDSREDGTTDGDTSDDSDDGLDPDPDGDDNPDETGAGCAADPGGDNCENDPTILTLPTASPQIGVAKTVNTPVANGDGTFTVTYSMLVENLGNVPLYDIRVADDLTANFGANVAPGTPDAPAEFTVGGVTVGSPTGGATVSTANSGYDGDGDPYLVTPTAGQSMPVGSTFTISFPLTFYPDGARAPFENQVRATGDVAEDGTADEDTVDLSDDGTDTDPNGNGDPGDPGEDDPTPFDLVPQIGIAKTVNTPVASGDGTYTVTYTLLVENLGQYELFDVRITDDLTAAFGANVEPAVPSAAGEYTVGAVAVGSQTGGATVATANGSYDGDADTALVLPVAGESMPVGSTFRVSFPVTFFPDTARSPWYNQARSTGDITENGTADEDTVDLSDDGTETDPDGNGDPGDPDEDDPTPLPPFDVAVNGIPVSGPVGIALLVLSIALLGWSRLRLV